MIARVWRGWTTAENADKYETLLKQEIFKGIAEKQISGYLGIQLLRRSLPTSEVEFMTVMRFESLEAVKAFAGEDFEQACVPAKARAVLARFDDRSAHYEIKAQIAY